MKEKTRLKRRTKKALKKKKKEKGSVMKFQILDTFEGFDVCNCNDASIKAIRGINFNETQRNARGRIHSILRTMLYDSMLYWLTLFIETLAAKRNALARCNQCLSRGCIVCGSQFPYQFSSLFILACKLCVRF